MTVFEIPFLINNPEILLNIDPTGEEMLSEYVRYFSKNYSKKKDYLLHRLSI